MGMGLVWGCAVDSRSVGLGEGGLGRGGTSGEPAACAGLSTSSCGAVYGSAGECASIVLACSADGRWPSAASCSPPALAGRCTPPPPDAGAPDPDCEPGAAGCPPALPGPGPVGGAPDAGGPDEQGAVAALCQGQGVSFDEMFQLMVDDVQRLDPDDRLFTRYLSLLSRFNAGVCSADLAVDRRALAEVVNLLSSNSRIVLPQAINAEETLYRIDLRDYGWERPVTIDNVDYIDGWEAIAGTSPYSMPFVGIAADALTIETGTLVSLLDSAALIDVAAAGSPYYALIGVDRARPLDDFLLNGLGVVGTALEATDALWAGVEQSRLFRRPQLAIRRALGVRQGYVWESRAALDEQTSLLASPLALPQGEAYVIFSLPNKLFGYAIADRNRAVAVDTELVIDQNQGNFRVISAISCLDCHTDGLQPIVDEVLPYVQANPINYDQDTFDTVQDKFASNAELVRRINTDNAERRAALDALSIPAGSRDPVSQVYFAFDRDLDLNRAAGELGVSPEVLRARLPELDSNLAVLTSSTLDRDDFAPLFLSTLCTLHGSAVNRPDPLFCP